MDALVFVALIAGGILGFIVAKYFFPTFIIEKVEIPTIKEKIVYQDKLSRTFLINNENHEWGSADKYIGVDVYVNKDVVPTRWMVTLHESKIMTNRGNKNKDEKPVRP